LTEASAALALAGFRRLQVLVVADVTVRELLFVAVVGALVLAGVDALHFRAAMDQIVVLAVVAEEVLAALAKQMGLTVDYDGQQWIMMVRHFSQKKVNIGSGNPNQNPKPESIQNLILYILVWKSINI